MGRLIPPHVHRSSPLLRAKLRAPEPPQHFVRRDRLHDLLDDLVAGAPLTLVVAPAGAGKTSLLAGWTSETPATTAWLSLDEGDRDPTQLWLGMMAALDALVPGVCDGARAMLRRPVPRAEVVVQLLDDLDVTPAERSVLVVDDLHLAGRVAAASMAVFVQHLPGWLRLVLTSRNEPPLPLGRMRARGQLGELRFGELRFSDAEAGAMLRQLADALTPSELDAAVGHAAGWAAGLQMAALSTRAANARGDLRTTPSEARSDLLVDDYLRDEVLAEVDAHLVDALLVTSIADRVNGSLAETLTGRPDAAELLAQVEADGLFVTRIGTDGWYEIHSLVRSAMRAELVRRSPSRALDLHARAAAWLEEAGETPGALAHWLAAGRHRDALRLLAARHAELYDEGREAVIRRTVDAIPPVVTSADLDAIVETAWCHLLVDRDRFLEKVDEATWWSEHFTVDPPRRARIAVLRSIAATSTGDWCQGGALARRAVGDLGSGCGSDPLGRFAWNMVARDVALGERWDDDDPDVRWVTNSLARDPERLLALEGTRALGHALAGRPADALRVAAGVAGAAANANLAILRTEVALAEAIALRELGDEQRSATALHALTENEVAPMSFAVMRAAIELVDHHLACGDPGAASSELDRVQDLAVRVLPGPGAQGWSARAHAQVALATGHLEDAQRWVELIDDPFWAPVASARICLAAGDRTGATEVLAQATPRVPRHAVVLGLLRARAGRDPELDEPLVAALRTAAAHALVRTVAAEVAAAPELLEAGAWAVPDEWVGRVRRLAVGAPGPRPAPDHHGGSLDSLTERERDVLRFLPSRLTLREIAAELYISVNTLKFHLKVIYGKLGVGSRAEAAAEARRMTTLRVRDG
jgi:LuxR family maltose regulon positive regulatory protein